MLFVVRNNCIEDHKTTHNFSSYKTSNIVFCYGCKCLNFDQFCKVIHCYYKKLHLPFTLGEWANKVNGLGGCLKIEGCVWHWSHDLTKFLASRSMVGQQYPYLTILWHKDLDLEWLLHIFSWISLITYFDSLIVKYFSIGNE